MAMRMSAVKNTLIHALAVAISRELTYFGRPGAIVELFCTYCTISRRSYCALRLLDMKLYGDNSLSPHKVGSRACEMSVAPVSERRLSIDDWNDDVASKPNNPNDQAKLRVYDE